MSIDSTTAELIQSIYGGKPETLTKGLERIINRADPRTSDRSTSLWSQRDVVLITYADQVRMEGLSPIQAQTKFLIDHGLDQRIRCVHLLPFCPFTSDDGFSVTDYLAVDPDSGSWEDIDQMGQSFDLMYDLVLNHSSQQHEWFQEYLKGNPQYSNFYIDQDPTTDLSAVVRPRSLPLLTQFNSADGQKNIWTTFSEDQVDLNYANPHVMLAMIETLVEYARRGARIIRLDAIAFLWKQAGTTCLHLPQTHAAVQLMRSVLDLAAPGTLVLTETNVPHQENISYFGDGTNEAHMVYQFSLPPLLLDAIHSGDTTILRDWLKTLEPPTDRTTFFNFTASHDGIGVRPLEGIVPANRVEKLVEIVHRHGGRVSMRRNADGSESPYELNITYLEAVADSTSVSAAEHSRRFLATQAIMLSMQGMPAIYFHSLVGSPNDQQGVEESGQNRRINRHKYQRSELEAKLADPHGLQRRVFDGYQTLLRIRVEQHAFHPNAKQQVIDLPGNGLLGFIRSAESGEQLAVIANLSDESRHVDAKFLPPSLGYDELAQERVWPSEGISIRPFQVRWLTAN